jgi:hypothetical protein
MVSGDVFGGLVDDDDYIGSWFIVRKIKTRHRFWINARFNNHENDG